MLQPSEGSMVLYDSIPRSRTKVFDQVKQSLSITMDIWHTERIADCTVQIDNDSSALFLLLNAVAFFGRLESPWEIYNGSNLPGLRKWLALVLIEKEVELDGHIHRP